MAEKVLERVYPFGSLHPMTNVMGMAYVPLEDIAAGRAYVAKLEAQVAALERYMDRVPGVSASGVPLTR